ncbi:hypothetical protein pb186bvf_013149 [Paramecium bursaria]
MITFQIIQQNRFIDDFYLLAEPSVYLVKSETQLNKLPFNKIVKIIPNNRLCENCWKNAPCLLNKKLTNVPNFKNYEQFIEQLKYEKVCPYQYYDQMNAHLQIGTHYDLFECLVSLKFNKNHFKHSQVLIEDCHEFAQKLELSCSIQLTGFYLRQILQNFAPNNQEPNDWEKKFYGKASIPFFQNKKADKKLSQDEYDILYSIVAFEQNMSKFQEGQQFLISSQTQLNKAQVDSKLSEYKYQNLQNLTNNFPQINKENFEDYLDLIYLHQKSGYQKHMMYQWFYFIKLSFDNQYLQSNIKEEDKCKSDYQLLFSKVDNQLNLICLNPQYGIKVLKNLDIQKISLISPNAIVPKIYQQELGINISITKHSNKIFNNPQLIVTKATIEQAIEFKSGVFDDKLALQLGKNLLMSAQQIENQSFIVLFSSKSFMQKCFEVWETHQMTSSFQNFRDYTWIKNQNKIVLYEAIKNFVHKCRTTITQKQQMLITQFDSNIFEIFWDVLEQKPNSIFQEHSGITFFLIGVPWANASIYQKFDPLSTQIFDKKLEWIQQSGTIDRKNFSLIYAKRNISQLQQLSKKLQPSQIVYMEDKFTWPQLWPDNQIPKVVANFNEALNEIKSVRYQYYKFKSDLEVLQNRIIQEQREQAEKLTSLQQTTQTQQNKRKISLQKSTLSAQFQKISPNKPVELDQFLKPSDQIIQQDTQEETKCVICWCNTKDDIMSKSSKCGHIACLKCWKTWLETKLECPLCRARVRQKFLIQI